MMIGIFLAHIKLWSHKIMDIKFDPYNEKIEVYCYYIYLFYLQNKEIGFNLDNFRPHVIFLVTHVYIYDIKMK